LAAVVPEDVNQALLMTGGQGGFFQAELFRHVPRYFVLR
jgi:hypothetical protein